MKKIKKKYNYKHISKSPFNKGAVCEADWGFLKRYNGITLIVLVITIVLMLILVSVTVNLATNGELFEYAERAKQVAEDKSEKETIQQAIIIVERQSKTGRITIEEMQKALNKILGDGVATAINNGDTIAIKFEKSEIYYNVDSEGKIEQFTP